MMEQSMEVDYIIVGAGSAGCVLAERLSRDTGMRVLIIEAGGSDARFWIKMPLGYAHTFSDPRVTWQYSTQTDPGLNNRSAYWPRGRVLGGSGSINAMAYVRGLPHDFDDWEAAGASGWNWQTVLKTYEKLESQWENGRISGDGPLCISDLSARMHPFSAHFLQAARELNWPTPRNMNSAPEGGLSYFRSTVKNGRRWSTADAFLRPALQHRHVQLVKHAVVERLAIDNGQAVGVHYRLGGQLILAKARREVIVSAGAINTPQLLQLSGIGPAALLQSHGIKVVQDLSQVGQGLQDHLACTHYFAATEPTLNAKLGWKVGQFMAGMQYLLTRNGPLSVPVNQVGGFIRSDTSREHPDMQVYCNPAAYQIRADGKTVMTRDPGFLLSVQPCRPTSRGSVTIRSANPADAPLIQANSLTTEHDCADAIRAGRLLQTLAGTPTIKRLTRPSAGTDLLSMNDEQLLDNFRTRASTNFHPTCTCRMGHNANDSVLDARLRVHGVPGLRVVDASAFPNVTSGNTNAPTIMLAMRAADLILEDARAK
ncbi:MAG: GMC family oxidoreductase N-terminal domain-containing protein [Thiolinea sp.]